VKYLHYSLISLLFTSIFCGHALALTDGQNFEDWRAKCVASEDKTKTSATVCHIFQDLLHKESGKRVLHLAIGKLPQQKTLTMIVTLPLGIALPQGITIRIDGDNAKNIPIQACFANGCQTAFQPEASWMKKFAAGNKAEIIFHSIQNQAISIPVSLKGVTAAINALKDGP
jgi:invasion protein IalB